MIQSLPSRNNRDEFCKSTTAPQSAELVVHVKNTKEHPKNKVKQKDLSQLIINILATFLKLKKYLKYLSEAELYSLITNVYKPPKNFGFPDTERSFRFFWFEEFTCVCYPRWENGAYCLPCLLIGHKVVGISILENLYRKPYRKFNKSIQETSKCSNGDTQKESNITY